MFIISQQFNIQTHIIPLYERKSYANLIQSADTSTSKCSLTLSSTYKPTSQYIWCVNHFGPNNQMKDFIKCAIIAIINNYTLVIPPLYPHYTDKIRNIQWFDHFYDLKQLGQVLNLITIDQFKQQTKNSGRKIMIECYIQQTTLVISETVCERLTLESVENHYKKEISFHRYINLSRNFNMNELSTKAKKCSSIFLHVRYSTMKHFFNSSNIYLQKILGNLSRTVLIQRMATQLRNLLPQLATGNQTRKKLTTLAVAHLRLGDRTYMNISTYVKQILSLINSGIHFTHLHIMHPYDNSSELNLLISRIPVQITTTKELLNKVRFVLDDFVFSVLEQEIAFQAPIFIASPWSSYSTTVIMQKVYQEKGSVYLFSMKGDNRPFLATKKNVKYPD
jgi:hypothetical protein